MSENNQDSKKGLSKQTKILLVAIPVLIIVTVLITVIILNMFKTEAIIDEPKNVTGKVMTEENYVELDQELKEKVAKGMFQTHMNTTWRFPDGKSASSNCVMGNSKANNYAFYFTVTLSDTSEVVFTSGLLPVGTQIDELVLDKELPKGTYPAVVNINMVDDDDQPVDSNTGFNITLDIKG